MFAGATHIPLYVTLYLSISVLAQELSAAGASSTGQGHTQPTNSKQIQQQYMQTYEKLLEYGFKSEQVQQALTALPLGSADQDAALNWLCLHLPAVELPQRFAGSNRGATGAGPGRSVKVRGKREPLHVLGCRVP